MIKYKMEKIFEQIYFFKILVKDDQISITNEYKFLKSFYRFGSYYLSFVNGVLLVLDKKVLYNEVVNVDFRVEPMQRISCFYFFLSFLSLTLTRDLSLNYSKYPNDLKVYDFFFFLDPKIIKKKFKINEKNAQYLSEANYKNEKYAKKIFLFYNFVFFLFFGGIAYLKIKDDKKILIFLVKFLLHIHLYLISNFCFKVVIFELLKQVFILNYFSLKIQNEIEKLTLIITSVKEKIEKSKIHVEIKKSSLIKSKLKEVFKNYNDILREKEKFKKQDANFASCFIISTSLVFFFLVLVVFYRNYNMVSTIFGFTLYISIITFFILPVVLYNLWLNEKVKKNFNNLVF